MYEIVYYADYCTIQWLPVAWKAAICMSYSIKSSYKELIVSSHLQPQSMTLTLPVSQL